MSAQNVLARRYTAERLLIKGIRKGPAVQDGVSFLPPELVTKEPLPGASGKKKVPAAAKRAGYGDVKRYVPESIKRLV